MKAFAALTWGKKKIASARPAADPSAEPQCEVLFDLFVGRLGAVQLGRLINGHDAGRLVALRKLAHPASGELASATDLARKIAHPKFAKSLGIISNGESSFIASEYISGVTWFELERAIAKSGTLLNVAVAVRIVLDALKATNEATRLLLDQAGLRAVRCMYPESIWVADFGEIFLSEILVAQRLAQAAPAPDSSPASNPGASAASADMVAAALELVRLTVRRSGSDLPAAHDLANLPPPLIAILLKAIGRSGFSGYATLALLIQELSSLDSSLIASEQDVSRELRRVAGPILEQRRKKLDLLERISLPAQGEDATKFFRVGTAEPPSARATDSVADSAAQLKQAHSSERRVVQRSEPTEDLTTVFQRQSRSSGESQPELDARAGELDDAMSDPIAIGVWRDPLLMSDALERQTSPNQLDPMLLESLGRTTSPNVFEAPLRPTGGAERLARASRPTNPASASTAAASPPARGVSRLKIFVLLAVAVAAGAAGAALHSAWLVRRAAHAQPGSVHPSPR